MRLMVAILSLMITSFAVANEGSIYTQDAKTAHEQMKNATGRIIITLRGPGILFVGNNCSATLVNDQETIITAGHCFKTKEILNNWQRIKKIKSDLLTIENIYFDIDGITSHHFSTNVRKLMDEDGFIRGKNIRTALGFVKSLPEIKKKKTHPVYKDNVAVDFESLIVNSKKTMDIADRLSTSYNPDSVNYDVALGTLSKKVNTKPVQVAQYNEGEDLFLSGYAGGHLETYLETYKCMTGDLIYGSHTMYFEQLLSEIRIVVNNLKTMFPQDVDYINQNLQRKERSASSVLALLKRVKSEGILLECPGGYIVRGFSGGPQFIVKNGTPMVVGISSSTPQTSIKYGELMLGAKAIHSKDIK